METGNSDVMNVVPLRFHHEWKVFVWEDGKWQEWDTVHTWVKNHVLACRKAKEHWNTLRKRRWKIEYCKAHDIQDLGMVLSAESVCGKNWPSRRVPDIYGEYSSLSRADDKTTT